MRLFVAAWPPASVLDAVAAIERPSRAGVRWTTRDQWHVTLRFLGEVADAEPVAAALRDGLAGVEPCEVVAGPAVAALGRNVVMVPVAGLDGVAAAVVASTVGFGRAPDQRAFHGHLTLARVKQGSARALAGAPISGRWTVDEVCLVRSRLHPQGARYDTVASILLGA